MEDNTYRAKNLLSDNTGDSIIFIPRVRGIYGREIVGD
jgi:hypothetical protein